MVGHSFTGDYSRRFHASLPEFHHGCLCGVPTRSVAHVLCDCPRFASARRSHRLTRPGGRRRTLGQCFNSAAAPLLDFLKATRAAFRPEVGVDPDAPFDPG